MESIMSTISMKELYKHIKEHVVLNNYPLCLGVACPECPCFKYVDYIRGCPLTRNLHTSLTIDEVWQFMILKGLIDPQAWWNKRKLNG